MNTNRHAAIHQLAKEQREFARLPAMLSGTLFIPAESFICMCSIVDLSVGGAGVQCRDGPPLNTFVVLNIDGFGSYEAVAARFVGGILGLRFVCRSSKRQRLVQKVVTFVDARMADPSPRGEGKRSSAVPRGFRSLNDQLVPCDILSISSLGLSLGTDVRPPVGEIVRLNHIVGRIRGHHAQGIDIQFISYPAIGNETSHGL